MRCGKGITGRPLSTNLSFIRRSFAKLLAVLNGSGELLVKLQQARGIREPRDIVMARRDNESIKDLLPPVVATAHDFSQRKHPLPVLLDGALDGGIEFEKLLVAAAGKDALDPLANDGVVPVGGRGAVLFQRTLGEAVWEGLLGVAHDARRDVAVEVLVDGGVGEALLVAVDGLGQGRDGRQPFGDVDGAVCLSGDQGFQRRDGGGEMRCVEPRNEPSTKGEGPEGSDGTQEAVVFVASSPCSAGSVAPLEDADGVKDAFLDEGVGGDGSGGSGADDGYSSDRGRHFLFLSLRDGKDAVVEMMPASSAAPESESFNDMPYFCSTAVLYIKCIASNCVFY